MLHIWIALGTVFATNSSRALSQGRFEPKATRGNHGARVQMTLLSHPSCLHVSTWQSKATRSLQVSQRAIPAGGSGHASCWCVFFHAIELRPVCTTLDCKVSAAHSPCKTSLHDSTVLPTPVIPSPTGGLSAPFPWQRQFPYGTCQSRLAWFLWCSPQHRFRSWNHHAG